MTPPPISWQCIPPAANPWGFGKAGDHNHLRYGFSLHDDPSSPIVEATVRMIGGGREAANRRLNLPNFSEMFQNPAALEP
jgi:hypothetical protein